MHQNPLHGLLLIAATNIVGCSNHPPAPTGPRIDPVAASARALELYDRDGDGVLNAQELTASPALAGAVKRLDQDGDSLVSLRELQGRLQEWVDSRSVLVDTLVEVSLDGRPLVGATITVEPETFLGDGRKAARAVTDETGLAAFEGHDQRLPGLHLGFYRVRISKSNSNGVEQVPAKYNASSELGVEVAGDKSNLNQFRLASR